MTDENQTPVSAGAPAPATASGPPPAATPSGGASVEITSPAEAIAALQADKEWVSDFNGANGRQAQKVAAERKTALLRPAEAPRTDIPAHLQEALDAAEGSERAEAYIPGAAPEDYNFHFIGVEDFDQLTEMKTTAADAAHAIGANPEYAAAAVKHLEASIARTAPENAIGNEHNRLDEAAAKMFGADAGQTMEDAAAAVATMPEAGRAWVQNTIRALDGPTAAWFTGRLATSYRAGTARLTRR